MAPGALGAPRRKGGAGNCGTVGGTGCPRSRERPAAGPTTNQISDLDITNDGKIAFAHYTSHFSTADSKGAKLEMVIRTTDCLKKIKGKWLIVHEHNSVPIDLVSNKPDLMPKQ